MSILLNNKQIIILAVFLIFGMKMTGAENNPQRSAPIGAINGVFSVGENTGVCFSQGNLQYKASTNKWQFATHQYDYIGDANSNISSTYTGWIDLFGWGTSGYNHGAVCYQPWSTSESYDSYKAYGNSSYNLYDQTGQADWGYNAISNGGNTVNSGWRTLTRDEWVYLFDTRVTASGIRYAKAQVNNVYGVILLPDDWDASYYTLNNTNGGDYSNNVITASEWVTLEQHGAVFLPAAGARRGTSVGNGGILGYHGNYWSASCNYAYFAWRVDFYSSQLYLGTNDYRDSGSSVRLVRSSQNCSINATPSPAEGGAVSGAGAYMGGAGCTLTATASAGYTFVYWTQNGRVVSADATYTFTVGNNRNLVAHFSPNGCTGKLNGVFSVGENTGVCFSQGNLIYKASTNSWRFAESQWDYVGLDNSNISQTYSVWIDLFGWGTSGYNHGATCYQPWSTSTGYGDYYAYGNSSYNLYDQTGQADWGYNAISNGGNTENGGWRTLTKDEWTYLFNTRATSSGIRYAKATVNGANGVILLPDDWSSATYSLSNTNIANAAFTSNTINSTQWNILEDAGAVFLPAAGYRDGTSVNNVGSDGYYWSASRSISFTYDALNVYFNSSSLSAGSSNDRCYGRSVRLVRSPQNCSINATPSPAEGGAVSGAGAYLEGAGCTLTATASAGYTFAYWTENGEVVSTDAEYTFTVTGNRTLVATFAPIIGCLNGVFTTGENSSVMFSQGNLQYQAPTNTWQFAENQWDYVGSDNSNISQTYSGWIDLFGWGTSGYNHGANCYQPWSTSTSNSDYYAYGNYQYNLFNQTGQADWGYNVISNGGNQVNSGWRTLTKDEWDYLFYTRVTSSGIRYAKATVNNVNGVILLPDDWDASYYTLNNTNGGNYSSNVITASQWATLEQHGAVFLPAAGYRSGTSVSSIGSSGYYWSASYNDASSAYGVYFYSSNLYPGSYYGSRYNGLSVRLVRSSQNCSINATPIPAEGGAVSGAGAYMVGAECTLTATASAGYTFAYWTQNNRVVSADASYTFTVGGNRDLVAHFTQNGSTGKLNGLFSVGENADVFFSQGNLQYQASTNTWRFAENQWDYVGSDNSNISQTYSGLIDLFGWGTSGYNHGATCYQPWSTSTGISDYYAYGSDSYNLYDQTGQADWGYNAIINGGNTENDGWRTLTKDEWVYLFNSRATASGIRYAKARVNNVYGVILLPDDWDASYYTLNNTNGGNYSSNVITASQWATLEQHGAVFLPAAGYRNGTSVNLIGSSGYYWSASYYGTYDAYDVYFGSSSLNPGYDYYRRYGLSVRLVRSPENCSFNINATPIPAEGGAVSGAGAYMVGAECTLTATASAGYTFAYWTQNNRVVSADASYTFTVGGNRDFVAHFTQNGGKLNGQFTVGENAVVCFSQGNLQYQASTKIWRFAENQWDYVGSENSNISSTHPGWIDLFGWGTSGYSHGANYYQPWSTSTSNSSYYAYGNSSYNLYDQTGQADWGYNAIINGGNTENDGWRTLTKDEWDYVFNTRITSSGIRYAKATVNNKNGVILLPDGWSSATYSLSNTNSAVADFTSNTISSTQWNILEDAGAVFLPAAGSRYGTSVYDIGSFGNYWSASYGNTYYAYGVYFNSSTLTPGGNSDRRNGFSVRLVRSSQNCSFGINATSSPAEGGVVSGAGAYMAGAECTLTATASAGYTFVYWTQNGRVVSADASYTFTVGGNRDLVAHFTPNGSTGKLNGQFTAGENAVVCFSQGNLQYQASTNTWRFAENQYDYVGSDNSNISQTYSGLIDLFGWGTSGYSHGANCYQPWSTSTSDYDYYPYGSYSNHYNYNLFEQTGQADWGYNAIINGGNTENDGWRTLTKDEWDYLFDTRATASGIRYAKAIVNNVNGVILLPDDWSSATYSLSNTNSANANFTSNTISSTQWIILEDAGAVFLPAAGDRSGSSVGSVGSVGYYWSASHNRYRDYVAIDSSNYAWGVYFNSSGLLTDLSNDRYYGQSVRLVRSSQNCSFGINATSSPAEGGVVSGAGAYMAGAECTLTATASAGYTFSYWTQNGHVVSTDAEYTFMVGGNRDLVAHFSLNGGTGKLNGLFSVGENADVFFSQGNLQYQASTNTWRFAENQWDYVGSDNSNISQTYSGLIDLFGWGTSGYNHGANCYQPWSTTWNGSYYAYGSYSYNLYDQTGQADWGYNAIINGGNTENDGWRTLTKDEWDYLFNSRATASGIRYAKARVNNVYGVILLPDDWDASYYTLNNTNGGNYSSNVITASQWITLEQHGAVFLPAAGYRDETSVSNVGSNGYYWSASYSDNHSDYAYGVYFGSSLLGPGNYHNRHYGFSVRLVRSSQNCSINATPIPAEGGVVSGAGAYMVGAECTLTATASAGYTFVYWTQNGRVVSADASYTFTVGGNRDLVAHFTQNGSTGKLNGLFSVGENADVFFSQGNLQYQASTNTWRFAENQWDYVGSDNSNISQTYSGLIDLFGWGTSGYNHGATCYQPWSTSTGNSDYYAYGNSSYNLFDQTVQADWGYNAIINGGNTENDGWRTLTKDEWVYLFNSRATASGIRYAKARVNNVYGVILLPDDWDASYYTLNNTNGGNYSSNVITASQWATLEQHGAVFLPAAGSRRGTSVGSGSYGDYWSASYYSSYSAYYVYFNSSNLSPGNYNNRHYGFSVRLVRSPQNCSINATPSPAEGGAVSGAGTYLEGTECTLTATASAGYQFVNWTENGELVSIDVEYTFTVTGARTLVANFSPNTYTVTLNTNSGTINSGNVTSYTYGVGATLPTDVTRTGYTFGGWYANSGLTGSPVITIPTTATGNKTFWAKWTANTYTVTLNTNNGTINSGNVTSYTYGVGATLPTNVTRTGYTFGGWYANSGLTGSAVTSISTTATGNKTYWAKWTANTYTVTLNTNGGTINSGNVTSYTYGVGATLPTNVTRTGYTFGGWFANSGLTGSAVTTISTTATGNKTYYAKWTINSYAITATANPTAGGTITGAGTYNHGTSVTLTATAATGYTFVKWTKNGTQVSTNASYSFTVTSAGEYVAHFSLNSYAISASANPTAGGTVTGAGTYDHFATCTLSATAATGYSFVNWTENNTAVSTSASYQFTVTGARTLVANFSPNTYTVTLNTNGGTINSGNVTSYTYGVGATLPTNVTRTGYTFGGWFANSGLTGSAVTTISTTATGNKTYYAKWTANTYTVTLNTNGGTINSGNVTSYTYGVGATLPTDVTRTGYTFDGWYDNSGLTGSTVTTISTTATGDKAFWAKWTINSYAITVSANPSSGGTVSGAGTYNHGTSVTLTATAATGYHFVNWTKNGTQVSTDASYSFAITEAGEYVAHFSLNSYEISANANPSGGGTFTGTGTYDHGSTCTLTAIPNEGYYFMYWKHGNTMVSTNASVSFVVTSDDTYTAYFDIFSYYVDAYADPEEYGSVTGADDYLHGSICTLTATANEGYHFVNWTEDDEVVSTDAVYSFTVTDNRELVAHFSINSYEITANGNPSGGGTFTGTGSYDHGSTCTLTAIPNEGYYFLYWKHGNTMVSTNASVSFVVTGDDTYTAYFDLYSYYVEASADPDDYGTVTGADEYLHGSTCTLTATANEGYHFVNWTEDDVVLSTDVVYSFTVTDNRELIAHFSINSYEITATSNPSAGGILTGAGTYNHGANVTLTATANEGYTFVNWTENGNEVATSASFSFTATEARSLTANFSINSYAITVTANPTEGGSVTGTGTYNHGTTVTLVAIAVEGYTFENWTKDDEVVSTETTYSFTATAAGDYVAHFSLNSYEIIASANYPGSCTITGAGTYDHGAMVTLTAVANTGYNFLNWTKDGVEVSTTLSFSFTATESGTYVANFLPKNYTITVKANPTAGGTVSGGGPHSHGSTCTLTATPNEGYYFLYWKKSGNIVSYSPIYSFEVTGGGIYTAYFSNVYTQEVSLTPGWNWWAPTVECTLAQLETALGSDGLTIKSKDASATYSNGQWTGTLTDLALGQMYRIETSNTCEFTLSGTRPASVTLTLGSGQNWFGCPGTEALTIANAFANFTPTTGDKVISQNAGFAIFNGIAWEGTLDTLQPGHGYVYVSQGGNTQTAIFWTPSK